ncbi:MAG TPA: carbohydrate ABC transporter permease [Candidatus Atribacteria bacterium]|nr:carbohydrate ABC transporter permease [Candidatus Atribacteria bacterium]
MKIQQNYDNDVNLKIKRRRWMNVGLIYLILLLFSVLFMGTFLFGAISSLKDNPGSWPPTLKTEQLSLKNWIGAYKLARQGGGSGFFGELKSGYKVSLEVTYKYPKGIEIQPPQIIIPKRFKGTGRTALELDREFTADFVETKPAKEIDRIPEKDGTQVSYKVIVINTSQKDFSELPLDLVVPYKVKFIKATLFPNRIERLGMVQSWNNLVSGVIPYVFHNHFRVFNENYSRSTGKRLFTTWIFNSFFICIIKVITTLIFASMAGYALARLRFYGKNTLFIFILFSMMIPGQVTFISNYLVLRDGIFGLTKLFGGGSLLNTFTGLIISGLVGASAVFIMKQFFEGLPREMEEAARIDGASTYQIFAKIMLPLAKPALGALTILTFQGVWNEFFWPLVVLTSPMDKFTLTIGLLSFKDTYASGTFDWGPILAGAIISALPVIILFIVFQRYFIEGISFSGIKG